MPNGGSDCCGTCWFNSKNKGEAGYGHARDVGPDYCLIRCIAIVSPFYTYCTNHPHRRPERDSVPIGPVLTGDSSGAREVWRPSPDTEKIRQHLLRLLASQQEQPTSEYPIAAGTDEVVVWQLGEFRERRAISDLRRIAEFDPASSEQGPFGRNRKQLVLLAQEALGKIELILHEHTFVCQIRFAEMDEGEIRSALERALPEMLWEEGDSVWDKILVSGQSVVASVRVFRYEDPGPFELKITLRLPEGADAQQASFALRARVLRALNATTG